jgi:hypothetical protein
MTDYVHDALKRMEIVAIKSTNKPIVMTNVNSPLEILGNHDIDQYTSQNHILSTSISI